MGKPKKSRTNKFNYSKNRRRAWKKSKEVPKIKCEQMKGVWDKKKSVKQNLKDMGISYDPNQTLAVPKTKQLLDGMEVEEMSLEQAHKISTSVVAAMEDEANAPQEKRLRLSEPEVRYCIYMMEKYGEDYKKMAKDPKNYYQDTPKQIRRKIQKFMSIPEQYKAYLKSKAEKNMDTN